MLTVVAERIFNCQEIDVADPIFDVPWKGASEDKNWVNHFLPIALSSELVPMNPRVSMEEF
jgi:hypothetical protein